uniref:Fibrinogen C-terminal domain-containing protein n=1 Tax=Oryzias latipes TaxID=8090 RepID=A0A3P9IGG3_ORYLA
MTKRNVSFVVWGVALLLLAETWAQSPRKKLTPPKPPKGQCCDEVRSLKVQVANLTSILEELSRKQETDLRNVVRQIMDLDQQNRQQEARVTEAESRYSEINNRVEIMQLQNLQSVTQTSSDAIYDCASLSSRNYKISGVYKLPKDELLGTPELSVSQPRNQANVIPLFGRARKALPHSSSSFLLPFDKRRLSLQVFCDMETNGGGWTLIQRRKIGLLSFNRDWKNYKSGFGSIRGDFWLGNDHIVRLTRQPTVLRIEMEDWEGQTRYAEYSLFNMANELNSYKLFIANYSGNAGDSLRYHNTTNFSTINRDNDKCVDDCAALRKGGYWYNCCTDSNLNGMFYRYGEHTKKTDGITWYAWHGPNYSLKKVEMKIRPASFHP